MGGGGGSGSSDGHHWAPQSEGADLRGLGIGYLDRRAPGVPPPQGGLAPSYDIDPSRAGLRQGAVTGSTIMSHPMASNQHSASYAVYALDDTPRRARMLMSPEQQRVLQALWASVS